MVRVFGNSSGIRDFQGSHFSHTTLTHGSGPQTREERRRRNQEASVLLNDSVSRIASEESVLHPDDSLPDRHVQLRLDRRKQTDVAGDAARRNLGERLPRTCIF